jgi:hypothetical protein
MPTTTPAAISNRSSRSRIQRTSNQNTNSQCAGSRLR